MKFRIGDKVKVIKKSNSNNCSWISPEMDDCINKIFIIDFISPNGNYSGGDMGWVFPPQSLRNLRINQQLLFNFMD